jgi:hypothetical protein
MGCLQNVSCGGKAASPLQRLTREGDHPALVRRDDFGRRGDGYRNSIRRRCLRRTEFFSDELLSRPVRCDHDFSPALPPTSQTRRAWCSRHTVGRPPRAHPLRGWLLFLPQIIKSKSASPARGGYGGFFFFFTSFANSVRTVRTLGGSRRGFFRRHPTMLGPDDDGPRFAATAPNDRDNTARLELADVIIEVAELQSSLARQITLGLEAAALDVALGADDREHQHRRIAHGLEGGDRETGEGEAHGSPPARSRCLRR